MECWSSLSEISFVIVLVVIQALEKFAELLWLDWELVCRLCIKVLCLGSFSNYKLYIIYEDGIFFNILICMLFLCMFYFVFYETLVSSFIYGGKSLIFIFYYCNLFIFYLLIFWVWKLLLCEGTSSIFVLNRSLFLLQLSLQICELLCEKTI